MDSILLSGEMFVLSCHSFPITVYPCDHAEFACAANQYPESTVKKKKTHALAHLVDLPQNVSAMFDNDDKDHMSELRIENRRERGLLSVK